jgi:hypothetical protein
MRYPTRHLICSTLTLIAASQEHLAALDSELTWTKAVIKETDAAVRASFDLIAEVGRRLEPGRPEEAHPDRHLRDQSQISWNRSRPFCSYGRY